MRRKDHEGVAFQWKLDQLNQADEDSCFEQLEILKDDKMLLASPTQVLNALKNLSTKNIHVKFTQTQQMMKEGEEKLTKNLRSQIKESLMIELRRQPYYIGSRETLLGLV